ncbi:MAG: hypothetical protein JWO95_86 [Verrucomicrobiales bacterium]|nr:hypothetical protein [Verrucomicrobiales bacterium]
MKNLRICIYFLCAVIFIGLRASLFAAPDTTAANTKAPEKQEGRYLFLIETSEAMDANKVALRKAMRSIIESGLNGQMKYGDTIGVWTYNDKLKTDFPMILWRNEHVQDVQSAVDFWMSKQKFVHRSDLSKGMPLLQSIIKASQKLTIIWMTTGNDQITGLPFATEIAELQKEFRDGFRKQHIPFVTLLAVRKGVIADFTVNPGDAKLRLPEVMEKEAAAPVVVATAPSAPVVEAPPVAKKPPLIIHVGPSPESVLEKSNAAIAAIKAAAQTNIPATQQTATNATPVAKPEITTNAPVDKPIVTTPQPLKSNDIVAAVTAPVAATSAPVAAMPTNAIVAPTNRASNASVVTSNPSTPAPVVVSVSQSNGILIALGAGGVVLLAGIFILLLVRKANAPKGPSFISQSMTREHLNSVASKPSSNNPAAPE